MLELCYVGKNKVFASFEYSRSEDGKAWSPSVGLHALSFFAPYLVCDGYLIETES